MQVHAKLRSLKHSENMKRFPRVSFPTARSLVVSREAIIGPRLRIIKNYIDNILKIDELYWFMLWHILNYIDGIFADYVARFASPVIAIAKPFP
jgi:hypothetical protein